MSSLKIKISQPNVKILKFALDGLLDVSTSEQFSSAIDNNISKNIQIIILDLNDLSYISSDGLRVLFQLKKISKEQDATLYMINPQPQVQKVFNIVKVMPLGSVFSSIQELDEYLDSIQKKVISEQQN